jgi:hypothetical protein
MFNGNDHGGSGEPSKPEPETKPTQEPKAAPKPQPSEAKGVPAQK